MTTDVLFMLAVQKLDRVTNIWRKKKAAEYRIADRLYREAKEARSAMDTLKPHENAC